MSSSTKEFATSLLKTAGVTVNGSNPWDIQVHDERFYDRVIAQTTLGLGESYMDGWWDAESVDQLIEHLLMAELDKKLSKNMAAALHYLKARLLNVSSRKHAFEIGESHYDIGNDLYNIMLDKRLVYTCGYWKNASNLDEAQEAKLDLVCRKIGLKAGQRVLDIGCGWGSFAKFAAEKYGAHVVGVTVSKEQVELGNKLCAGLPVELRLQDYRDVNEKFDHIVSLGMFEHVGYKNYRTYMEVAERCLKDDGLFLLHSIGSKTTEYSGEPWTEKYIFTNSMLPSINQIAVAAEGLFIMEDWHNFGSDYEKTLLAWFENFEKGWPKIKDNYSPRFYRMWKYYLLSFAGTFRARKVQLWQIVFSKKGVIGGYQSVR